MLSTTLNKIRAHQPCASGWKKLLDALGKTKADDEPLLLLTILESNGLDDCLWALHTVPEYDSLWRKYAVWCARQIEHLMTDERSKLALDVAWRHSNGEATDDELAAAGVAACDAALAASSDAAWVVVRASASASASDVAGDVAWAVVRAAAKAAASDVAGDVARAAVRAAQAEKLQAVLTSGEMAWPRIPKLNSGSSCPDNP